MDQSKFYKSQNLEKYPSGLLNQCKKCITMHVDNWNPDTYLWILEECDVPYIQKEWNDLILKLTNEGKEITNTTILGRYLGKMRLNQWAKYRWKDNEIIQKIAENEKREAMKKTGYSDAEIDLAIQEGKIEAPPPPPPQQLQPSMEYEDEIMNEMVSSLTDEDKKYLRLKWGRSYSPAEWIQLEKLWNDMEQSYDIQTAGDKDNLRLLCKTSLKADQLIDQNDIEGYQKMTKVYDQQMKNGNFTAAQNKSQDGEFISSISELVSICEKEGFIPRYYVEQPQDKVDATIQDLKNYSRDLIINEMNLGNLIENAAKQMAEQEAREEDSDDDIEEKEIFNYNQPDELDIKDYEDFQNFLDEERNDS